MGAQSAGAQEAPGSGKVMVVVDGSGSMWGRVDGEPKIVIARKAIETLVSNWPDNTEIGLMAYGHRRKSDCADIETLVPVGKLNRQNFMTAVNSVTPIGKTPISAAVQQAANAIEHTEEKATVILISDGLETCQADPCATAKTLEEQGVDLTVHVVGFDLKGEDASSLRCIADNTGGRYLSADNAPELGEALNAARAIATADDKDIFTDDAEVLARFEFNGSGDDISGNDRHGKLTGGTFVDGVFGKGLKVGGTNGAVGLDWSEYASLLEAPYTIEMVLTPQTTQSWGKLFGFSDRHDNGWYYKNNGLQAYPNPVLAPGSVSPSVLHYLVFVALPGNKLDAYYNGEFVGKTNTSFSGVPEQALFFIDDTATGRREQIDAVIESVRISKCVRTAEEVSAIWQRTQDALR
jgi:Ca-activated chloride channel family protein